MDIEPSKDAEDFVDTSPALVSATNLKSQRELKIADIRAACDEHDLTRLVRLATEPDGLINDETRKIAWPILLGCSRETRVSRDGWRTTARHRDEDQVKLDVDRAMVYDPGNQTERMIDNRKLDLLELITQTLRLHPSLCYFQGYHDIVQVIMLVLGKDNAEDAVARLSLLRIRDFMLPTLSPAVTHLRLLPSILRSADPDVAKHLSHTEPFFALAATLTLYAHDIQEYGSIARLFDFLLAREAVLSIYLFAVIIVSRRTELLEIEFDEPEMLHSVLCKLPKPLNLESMISKTVDLFEKHPPQSLAHSNWFWISSYSVLKTTRNPNVLAKQTLADGERFLARQSSQVRIWRAFERVQAELLAKRQPARTVGLAVAIAVLAYWLRRDYFVSAVGIFWQRLSSMLPL